MGGTTGKGGLSAVRALGFWLLFLLLAGCGSSVPVGTPQPMSAPGVLDRPDGSMAAARPTYVIHAGDQLAVKFFYNPELNEDVTVRPDGRIALQLAHEIMAAGLTTTELVDVLTARYAPHIRDPEITVIVKSFEAQKVFVDGQVTKPGMVRLTGPMTILQSIASAGGLKDSARDSEILVIRRNALKKPFVIRVDLARAMSGLDMSQDILLQPYDIVYVPKSLIANINTWVDLYLRRNVPINIGMYYDLNSTY
ncbi:polysaccharide biosynthesis/export family protein [Thermodesulfobacteriota bacterium B35]